MSTEHRHLALVATAAATWLFSCGHQNNPDAVNRDTVISMDATSDAANDPGVAYVFVGSDDEGGAQDEHTKLHVAHDDLAKETVRGYALPLKGA